MSNINISSLTLSCVPVRRKSWNAFLTGTEYRFIFLPECYNPSQDGQANASGSNYLQMLLYAEDIIFSRDQDQLQEILNIINGVFDRYGLTISDKTKTMAFNGSEKLTTGPLIIKLQEYRKM